MFEEFLAIGEQFRIWLQEVSLWGVGVSCVLLLLLAISPALERFRRAKRLTKLVVCVSFNMMALTAFVCSWNRPDGQPDGETDGLLEPRMVMRSADQVQDCPVVLPTEFSTNGLYFSDIIVDGGSLYIPIRFPTNICEEADSIDIFATQTLGYDLHWKKMYRFSPWPNTPGVVFAFDEAKVRKYGKFFNLFGDKDTDGDGHTDAEEMHEYGTSATSYDYAPEPEMIVGDNGVLVDVTPTGRMMDESGVGPAVSWTKRGEYLAAVSGRYNLICVADDDMTVTINGVSSRGYWSEPEQREIAETNEVHLVKGSNPITISFRNNGDRDNPYHRAYFLELIEEDTCPTLTVSQTDFKISPKFSVAELAAAVATASYEDACGEHNCHIEVRNLSSELVRIGSNSVGVAPSWKTNHNRAKEMSATFVLVADGEDIANQECTFSMLSEDDETEEDECDCGEKTKVLNDCVSFSQRFGRAPHIPWIPTGKVVIKETYPSAGLYTPAVLKYDHPMMRELVSAAGYDALIRDPLGGIVEYKDGVRANQSAGIESQFYHDGTNYIERLSRNLEVVYNQGRVAYLRGEHGKRISVEDLRITVSRDDNGVITAISSIADGEMSVSSTGPNAWEIVWTSPSGRTVKTFSFSGNGTDDFSLHEERDETFAFDYHWMYDDTLNDWRYEQGRGSDILLRNSKSVTYNGQANRWETSFVQEDANGHVITTSQSVLDLAAGAARTTNRCDGVETVYSATRDANGYLAVETNEKGQTTSYTRDRFGRILSERTRYADSLDKETTYRYAFGPKHNVDTRPIEKIVKIGGLMVEHELYKYWDGCSAKRRFCESSYRESFVSYDNLGREKLSVQENGRARQTEYTSLDASGGWTETITEGIWRNMAFEPVEDKSTRRVRLMSAQGNATNIVEYVYVNDSWHETSSRAMTYDAAHRVTSTTYSDGRTSAAEWICTGAVWERDTEGIVTSNEYNSVKALIRSTRYGPSGAVETSYLYDAAGRVTNETQRAEGCPDRVRSLGYDSRGRIAWEIGFDGIAVSHSYSNHDRTHTKTYADGSTEVTTVNTDGTLASITGSAVVPCYYTYDVSPFGEIETTVRYGSPISPKYETTVRNAYGEVTRKERSGYNGVVVTTNVFDSVGHLIREVTDGEPVKTYKYDDWGDVTSFVESADGLSRTNQYENGYVEEDGTVFRGRSETRSADGCADVQTASYYEQVSGLSLNTASWQLSINKYGTRTESASSFDPSTSTRRIEAASEMVSNRVSQVLVDGNLVESVSASAVTNRYEYNAYGWRTAAIDGRGNRTTYEYDNRGNLIRETDAAGGVISCGYDAMNRLVAVTNQVGNVTRYEYDVQGHKTYEGGATYPVRYTYDNLGNRITMTTYRNEAAAVGDTTTWVYDTASGLVIRKVYADGHGPSYTYTPDGKLASRTWARGIVTNYAYDGWGNLTSTTYSDDTPSIEITYDAFGRKTSVTDASGVISYEYDSHGDLAAEHWGGLGNRLLHRNYDQHGRDIGYSVNDDSSISISYDANTGRIASFYDGGTFTWDYLYGSDLKRRVTYPNGAQVDYAYEAVRDLIAEVYNHFGTTNISRYAYTNDVAGRRTSKNLEAYSYNVRDELVGANEEGVSAYSYSYDDIGNRTSSNENSVHRDYAANNLNQYVGADYDLDGNQTNVVTSTGTWSVTYNGENRPVRWANGDTVIAMDFDSMGRRTFYKEMSGTNEVKFVRLFYDGYKLIQELSGDGSALLKAFAWDPTEPVATKPLVYRDSHGTAYYMHDGNKNVTDLISSVPSAETSLPEQLAHYGYAPFGAVTSAIGTLAAINPFRFSAECHDDTLGLVYYNYRHYDCIVGRWLSRDSLDEQGGLCLYMYCNNRPEDRVDSKGAILFVPIVFAKALASTIAGLMAYQTSACYYATHDLQEGETDAYKHCYISCAYSKCMENYAGKYVAQIVSMLGGFVWEVLGAFSENGSFSVEDLKSDLIGAMGSLDYSNCEEPCKCEKGKVNPK